MEQLKRKSLDKIFVTTSVSFKTEEPAVDVKPRVIDETTYMEVSSTIQRYPYQWMENQKQEPPKPSDFSIEHILNHAGNTINNNNKNHDSNICGGVTMEASNSEKSQQLYDWLQCTRYRPPKLQRSRRREGSGRRKLGRNPRIPFSGSQVAVLEDKFRKSPYLSSSDVAHLSNLLRLSDSRIKIWFQNRRARERRDREGSREGMILERQRVHVRGNLHKSTVPVSAFTPTFIMKT